MYVRIFGISINVIEDPRRRSCHDSDCLKGRVICCGDRRLFEFEIAQPEARESRAFAPR